MELAMPKQQQILVRLPDDLASRLAHVVAPRQRSRFFGGSFAS
jgi:predicted transcriptional regulator